MNSRGPYGCRFREIREYGWKERFVSTRIGINSRLDPIQAAILDVKLRSFRGAMRGGKRLLHDMMRDWRDCR
jgi:dTDP-4-amino-4,6-dideoxygalactose transaminase